MILKIAGAGLLLAFACSALSELGFKGRRALSLLGCVAILCAISGGLEEIINQLSPIANAQGVASAAAAAGKIIGTGYIFGICADTVQELGEPLVAKGLITAARFEMLLVALPYFSEVIRLGLDLIK